MKILAYLITRLAKKGNPKIKFTYLGDSIMWGYMLLNIWLVVILYDVLLESFFGEFVDKYSNGKILNPYVITAVLLMIFEFFIFFSKDQWKEFIPAIEKMNRKERRKLCWRVIWFLLITVPLSIVILLIKHPMLTTWTG